jgi:putative cardiolipin synthase
MGSAFVPQALKRAGRRFAALAALAVLAGCASLPAPIDREPSRASDDVGMTTLAGIAAASTPADANGRSGFRLLTDGSAALEARIALIRRAEKTLDVQYYLIANDDTGRRFLAELAAAATRGVRVRVLVDDLYAVREDALFADLAGQPGFEMRFFNPLPVRGGSFASRAILSAHEFARINHRMHNKLLIADNSFAVTGGRNIADEYFGRGGGATFIDMDLLSSGPVVAELSSLFDDFWNSPYAYPVASLLRPRQRDAAARGEAPAPTPAAAEATTVAGDETGAPPLADELARGRVAQRFAPARLVADRPAQIAAQARLPGDGPVMRAHLDLIAAARSSVLVATPYFVPGPGGIAALREARAKDVRFTVLTNSLATTDEPLVHFGYARYRLAMLKLGVGLHELMVPSEAPADSAAAGHGASLGRLHAKLVVIDDRWVSIGSMNMDRRSARANTEAAILIDDAGQAGEVAAFIERGRASDSYELRLDDGGKRVEWLDREGGTVLRREPRRPGGAGLKPRLASFFVSEELL